VKFVLSGSQKDEGVSHFFIFIFIDQFLWPLPSEEEWVRKDDVPIDVGKTTYKKSELLFMTEQSCCTCCGAGRKEANRVKYGQHSKSILFFFIG